MIYFQETIFTEIDLQDFSVAASGIKNDNNSFTVSVILNHGFILGIRKLWKLFLDFDALLSPELSDWTRSNYYL